MDREPPESLVLGLGPRSRRARHTGLVEAVDETSAWILLGLGAAAFLTPLLDPTALAGVPSLVAVPAAALLGMPLYVCASGSTPLAAVLVAKGLSPGAAIAFLLTGPATNVTTFGVLSRLHDRRTAVAFATLMFLGASAAGLATDALLAPPASEVAGDSSVHVHNHGTLLQWACTLVLAAVVAASLLRQGIRRYLGQLLDTPSLAELTGGPAPTEKAHSCCH
ncbi:MAG: permease [Planctomycetota bacterium]